MKNVRRVAEALLALTLASTTAACPRNTGAGGADGTDGDGVVDPPPHSAAVDGSLQLARLLQHVARHVPLPPGTHAVALALPTGIRDALVLDAPRRELKMPTLRQLPSAPIVVALTADADVPLAWADVQATALARPDDPDAALARACTAETAATCVLEQWVGRDQHGATIALPAAPPELRTIPGVEVSHAQICAALDAAFALPPGSIQWFDAGPAGLSTMVAEQPYAIADAWPRLAPEIRQALLASIHHERRGQIGLGGAPAVVRPLGDGVVVTFDEHGPCGTNAWRIFAVDDEAAFAPVLVGQELAYMECMHPRGRTPAGLPDAAIAGALDDRARTDARRAFYQQAIVLEEASVVAFERLACDLVRVGAPAALVARARVAAGDERRHAAAMRVLAARHGVDARCPPVADVGERPLAELARENAVEGCVREGFAAVLALAQAARAADPTVAAALATIADEECAHAQLSWDLHAWMLAQLPAAARASIVAAARAAATALEASAEAEARHAHALTAEGALEPATAAGLARGYAAACERALAVGEREAA